MIHSAQGEDQALAATALETLCHQYWYPVYAYLRRSGKSEQDAEDLTQLTFLKLVTPEAILHIKQERGRLRSFLIGIIRQVISRQNRHDGAEKRGGGAALLSLDATVANERYLMEPVDYLDPQRVYDQAWVRQILESVRAKLRASFARTGRIEAYEILEPYLGWEEPPSSFQELAERMKSNENSARVLVHRLRKKFRELLEAEIALTVCDPADVPGELEWFRSALT